jgi:predicted TIM-barrel fold metal-dependent hydrolase
MTRTSVLRVALVATTLWLVTAAAIPAASTASPAVDHHQHLFRSGLPGVQSASPFGASELIAMLDELRIPRAVVLSQGYQYGNPNRPAAADEYAQVKEENDWTSAQVARYPERLVGFCGLNPLKDYALQELRRCGADPRMRRGIKLHFGNSDVQLDDPGHLQKLRQVFAEAGRANMAIVIHMRGSVNRGRPHGAVQARKFLERLVPAAPNVPIQIAHLAGAGGYDSATDEALAVFANAAAAGDPRMKNVFFDVSGVAGVRDWKERVDLIVQRIRSLGTARILFGSDGAVPGSTPREAWAAFLQLPLTAEEFAAVAGNVAPYLR